MSLVQVTVMVREATYAVLEVEDSIESAQVIILEAFADLKLVAFKPKSMSCVQDPL